MSVRHTRMRRVLGAWTLVGAVILHPAVACSVQSARISTSWLKNDLRVVMVEIPDVEGCAIRLLVDDGPLRVPRRQQHVPHIVEHLCFHELTLNPDIAARFRQGGVLTEAWTTDFAVGYAFDAPGALAVEILSLLQKQWQEPFADEIVRRETERIRHELRAVRSNSYLMQLALKDGSLWELARDQEEHTGALDTLQTEVLWKHFEKSYVGKRMTLILVASPVLIRNLEAKINKWAEIEAGELAQPAQFGDLSWLTGLVGSSDLINENLVGLRFRMSADLDPLTRYRLRKAVSTYVRDRLALADPIAYDFDVSQYDASDAEVWIFNAYTDFLLDSRATVHQETEAAFRWLASDSARTWWQEFVDWDRAPEEWWLLDPMLVGDDVLELAKLTPHQRSLPGRYPWRKGNPDSLHAAYQRAIDAATYFKLGVQPIERYQETEYEDDPLLVQLAWAVADLDYEHPWSLRLTTVLSVLLGILLVRYPPHLDRTTTSLRLQRKHASERRAA